MHWLFRAYLNTFLYVIAVMAAVLPAGIIAQTMGGSLGKLFEIDPQLIMGIVFFAVFGLEVYLFDLARKWFQGAAMNEFVLHGLVNRRSQLAGDIRKRP